MLIFSTVQKVDGGGDAFLGAYMSFHIVRCVGCSGEYVICTDMYLVIMCGEYFPSMLLFNFIMNYRGSGTYLSVTILK